MERISRWLLAAVLALASTASSAAFHLWQITEFYSNADGSVQFVELTALAGGQQFLSGPPNHTLTSSNGGPANTLTFTTDLPGDTAGKKMLIGTTGFAALAIVTPDYVVPNNFFHSTGTINFAEGFDTWNHPAAPTPPLSLNRDGSTGINSPTNFAGQTGSIPPPPGTIGFTPSPVNFSNTSMNTTGPVNMVTITNNHSSTITVSSIVVSGDFASPGNTCNTVNPGATCSAGLYFTPTDEGTRNGTLTVNSDAPGSPHSVTLTGVGERSLVVHYYLTILRRSPDAGGKSFWESEAARVAALGANVNETWFAMAQQFYFSGEYAAFNRDNTQFVIDLYRTFFNRVPDAGGLAFWEGNLAGGMPREVALASFMFSPEFRNFAQAIFGSATVRAEVDAVVDFYRGLLSRLPDSSGFTFWRDRFRAAQCQNNAAAVVAEVESISSAFALSGEYAARGRTNAQYVGDLYNAFLRRGGDQGGVQFWIGQLDSGAQTREQLRVAFKNSPEFQVRVNAIVSQSCVS